MQAEVELGTEVWFHGVEAPDGHRWTGGLMWLSRKGEMAAVGLFIQEPPAWLHASEVIWGALQAVQKLPR